MGEAGKLDLAGGSKILSARPQVSRNRRRTLRGTLRISASRERSWRAFSAACTLGGLPIDHPHSCQNQRNAEDFARAH